MIHFIPAWYQKDKWCETEQSWYIRRNHTEFDDTVKQIQLFHRSGMFPYEIMLLSFTPNFRHFLHRQSVYNAPYWSCFDAIQEITRKKVRVFSYHDLSWPDNTEFIYTPFVIVAMCKGEKYAQVEFGEDGNPISIDMYRDHKLYRRNIYDDRGFVSSSIIFENGIPLYQDYFMENGSLKMRCFESDGHVQINQSENTYLLEHDGKKTKHTFKSLYYSSLEQVIKEVTQTYTDSTDSKDIFCAAMQEMHNALLEETLKGKMYILSFFENRYEISDNLGRSSFLSGAKHIITDSEINMDRLICKADMLTVGITNITPYDTRVDFGISQQLKVQKIVVPVDDVEDELFDMVICELARYIQKNDKAMVYLFTRKSNYGRQQELLEKVRKCLVNNDYDADMAVENRQGIAENRLEEVPVQRFFAEQCVDELSVSKCMREQRLIVDMRKIPDLYLQIVALSIGIPQIVRTRTQFIVNGRNGLIIKSVQQLYEALEYYLDGLKNWNAAMMYSYELGKKHTTEVLVQKWKEVIESIESD